MNGRQEFNRTERRRELARQKGTLTELVSATNRPMREKLNKLCPPKSFTERFQALTGAARTKFYRAHKSVLIAESRSATQ